MKKPTIFHALMCASALTMGAAAFAQGTAAPQAAAAQAAVTAQDSRQTQLSVRDVYDAVEKQGYRNITEIELDKQRYEVKADDAQGQRVKLHVDPRTGKIESVRRKD